MSSTYYFRGFDLPVDLVNKTGGGVETFEKLTQHHINLLKRFLDIKPTHHVLEIGCGIGRDAIPLTETLSSEGCYLGIDIIEPSIEFCRNNITARHPNFQFLHYNIKDDLHNPEGKDRMVDQRLPLDDNSVDRIFAWSVLTHLWEEDIRHYLAEFRRVLKADGLAYLTCFLVSPEIVKAAVDNNPTRAHLTFRHKVSDECFIDVKEMPLGAIGFTANCFRRMVADSGLKMERDFIRGAWSGFWADAEDGQDGMLLSKL
ncbi:MAG: class I SAM-dependent methyltransferase [Parvularculaceae bacterium]|nr:class I SAM-dependent methyltransferase [Parvularculaceae bacterium]